MSEQVVTLGYGGIESSRPRLSVRRPHDPPRDAEGKIYCDHIDCKAAPPTFRRLFEWNKHMDKHERPYKCREPGCKEIKGFTYSGGLLRHQREVHKKNNDAKEPVMCPYPYCNRSTGNGFTRQENLRTHLRRRHRHNTNTKEGTEVSILERMPWGQGPSLKHGRDVSDDGLSASEDGGSLHQELKRLRHEIKEKDLRLDQLEHVLADLQQTIPRTPLPEYDPQLTQARHTSAP